MNCLLPRGVPNRENQCLEDMPTMPKSGCLRTWSASIRLFEPEISSWLWKTGPRAGFSANP
jgi:hypothetical protein